MSENVKSGTKRAFDFLIAVAALLFLFPVLLLIVLLTLLTAGAPVLFRQERIGRFGRPFTLAKIRTMREAFDAEGRPLPDDARVTRLGRLIRRFRLDELPGFLAVVTGRMAIVGPRPLPTYVLDTIAGSAERSQMRPGFTGLAQVSGNTLLTNSEKIALDIHYVRHWTLAWDLAILLRTVATIASGEKRDEPLIELVLRAAKGDRA